MRGLNLIQIFTTAGILLGPATAPWADDWPQFLGPHRNGSTTNQIAIPWPADGPVRRWKLAVGSGFSGPVIRNGKVIVFDRRDDQERVQAIDVLTGKPLWEHRAPTAYVDTFGFDNGPRGTPATTRDRVVTFGAEGRLTCLRLADGVREWAVETGRELGGDKGFFGPACSPLIVSNRVLINLGNRQGGGVAAFALDSGRLLWKRTDHEAGYASPVLASIASDAASTPVALFFTREGLVGTTLDGDVRFTHPWRSRQHASVNAASPVVFAGEVFLTASYDTGGTVIRLNERGVKVVWANDESLSAHYATPVVHRGFLYGFHGRQEQGTEFRCVEWATGKVRWNQENLGAGTVVSAGDRLVLLLESGEVLVAEASPERFRSLARAQILGRDTRAAFALAEGALVARDPRQLVCYEVGGGP